LFVHEKQRQRNASVETLTREAFSALTDHARVLEKDPHGDKVLERDGRIIKLFRRKRLLTLAAIYPYSLRFVRNAQRLRDKNIPSVTVERIAACPELNRQLVIYPKLPGTPLRAALGAAGADRRARLLENLARFVARLHDEGVYFRSLHLGNVLLQADDTLALIDIADMRILPWRLGAWRRVRNFRHLLRSAEDRGYIHERIGSRFLEIYLQASRLPPILKSCVRKMLASAFAP
jgi:tRNA A-37 threonylcarbamoyl transferase component Bud32